MNSKNLRSAVRLAPTSRGFARTAILAGLLLGGATTLLAGGVQPAHAECKYGGPNCITKTLPGPQGPGSAKLPGTGWQDPDCLQFGNCNSSELKGTEVVVRHPSSGLHASLGNSHQQKR